MRPVGLRRLSSASQGSRLYLVGAPHPHKADAQRLLERCIAAEERLVTDVEVLEEILHRYTAIGRRDANSPAFEALLGMIDEVHPIELPDVERAFADSPEWQAVAAAGCDPVQA